MRKTTINRIKNAIETHNNKGLPLFCILHEVRKSRVDNMSIMGWVVVTEPNEKGCLEVTKDDAKTLIDICNLLPVHTTNDGTVYDTASLRFRSAYQGAELDF